MVIEAEIYPHGGYQKQAYAHGQDYYSSNSYGHSQDHHSENGYYESGSSLQLKRPNICTPQPHKQFVAGHDDFAYQESGYGGKYQSFHDHNDSHGFSSGLHQGGGTHSFGGHASHGFPKPSNGMHMGYESHHGAYMQMRPGKIESTNYDSYHGESRNRCPPYFGGQQQMGYKSWSAKGADAPEWTSKGL